MIERELSHDETKVIYNMAYGMEPYKIEYEKDCSELYYNIAGKKYRLIYDRECDWFLDIAYEGDYE